MKYLPLLAAVLLIGCPHNPQPPRPVPGPTPEVRDTDKCMEAYENLEKLRCLRSDGKPMWVNADGEPFSQTCHRLQEGGGIFVDPACIATAATCKEANACPPSSK